MAEWLSPFTFSPVRAETHSDFKMALSFAIIGRYNRADYMEIFIPDWNFNSVLRVEKNCNYMKNFNPGWNVIASGKYGI